MQVDDWSINEGGAYVRATDDGHVWSINRKGRLNYLLSFDGANAGKYRRMLTAMKIAGTADEKRELA